MGAIGVFDSGVGGLSVLREVRRELPHESLLYVADSGHAPYGEKTAAFVVERSRALAEHLIAQGADALVVACNTATAEAVDALRGTYHLPIVGIEPGVKPAVETTTSGVVGVLVTSRTASSPRLASLLARFAGGARVLVQPCPGWVELVERGALEGEETERAVRRYIEPLLAQGADVLALGCTHYSFLASAIRSVVGPHVSLVDPAPAVARHLRRRLDVAGLLSPEGTPAAELAWTSGSVGTVAPIIAALWGSPMSVAALPARFG